MFKFKDIITMANVGLMKATSHTLSVQGAYTLTRLKSEVSRLTNDYQQRDNALPKEVGIEDAKAFDARQEELNKKGKRTEEEEKEWEDNTEKLARLMGLRETLQNDEVTINCRPMSYEDWHHLKQENKELMVSFFDNQGKEVDKRELFDFIEILGEGVLWKAPEE